MASEPLVVEAIDVDSPEARACLAAYVRELGERFAEGFDASKGPASDPAEFRPPGGVFLVIRLAGEAVACGALRGLAPGVGEVKRMWVAPHARGRGVARTLLAALEHQAAERGFVTLKLDTNRALAEARAMYARHGYREIPAYNDNPYAHHWFEKVLDGGSARR